jgi:hypothetical protein
VVLPEDGVAVGVDCSDGHAGIVGVMEVDRILKEVLGDQFFIDPFLHDFRGGVAIQRRASVRAQSLLDPHVFLADSATVLWGKRIVVYREIHDD